MWSTEPTDPRAFSSKWDRFYGRTASLYAAGVRMAPFWRSWIGAVLPHIHGPRVLEVSPGTGWLLSRYAAGYDAYGVDLNAELLRTTSRTLDRAGEHAPLVQADVVALPWPADTFDTVLNTMSFSGYADGDAAMGELRRVLGPGGRVVLVDVAFPADGNRIGTALARFWQRTGDVIRDLTPLFERFGFSVTETEVGGFGSVHLFVAELGEGSP